MAALWVPEERAPLARGRAVSDCLMRRHDEIAPSADDEDRAARSLDHAGEGEAGGESHSLVFAASQGGEVPPHQRLGSSKPRSGIIRRGHGDHGPDAAVAGGREGGDGATQAEADERYPAGVDAWLGRSNPDQSLCEVVAVSRWGDGEGTFAAAGPVQGEDRQTMVQEG